ncbi:MAG: 8-amino-7-oxononanoate synthase [Idiomarina sp.]|nr:8-amino-7-oxononanoate synthase [Idiomarina sp.]
MSSPQMRRRRCRAARESSVVLDFSKNDYLGLSQHPQVKKQFVDAANEWGVGSTGSPLLSGYSLAHQRLEAELSEWLEKPAGLLFSSGFAANVGVLNTLVGDTSKIYADKLVHASLIDGIKQTSQRFKRYAHSQPLTIAEALKPGDWLVTEGVFSMDGDDAGITQLIELKKRKPSTTVMVDDAHGIGVLGDSGKGALSNDLGVADIMTGTFGKAFGVGGAFVCADQDTIEALIQFCREYIYSTAMPPAQAAAASAALMVIKDQEGREKREHLAQLAQQFQLEMSRRGLVYIESSTPIQSWLFESEESAKRMAGELSSLGYLCHAIVHPTVPKHSPRIRFSLNSNMQPAHISQFWHVVDGLLERDNAL